jgi:hypothetical protein
MDLRSASACSRLVARSVRHVDLEPADFERAARVGERRLNLGYEGVRDQYRDDDRERLLHEAHR